MGTHPIFESDFDCLTDVKFVIPDRRQRCSEFPILYPVSGAPGSSGRSATWNAKYCSCFYATAGHFDDSDDANERTTDSSPPPATNCFLASKFAFFRTLRGDTWHWSYR